MNQVDTAGIVPYLLFGDARRQRLQAAVGECIVRWYREWATSTAQTPTVTLETDCLRVQAPQTSNAQVLRTTAAGRPKLEIVIAGDALTAVLGIASGKVSAFTLDPPVRHGLGEALQLEAMSALAGSLLAAAGCNDAALDRVHDSVGDVLRNAGRGRCIAVQVRLGSGGALILLMSPGLADALAPVRRKSRETATLTERVHALHPEPVHIEVLLGQAQISLGELTSLAPGNVVVFGETPLQPILRTRDAEHPFAEGELGCTGGKCAVRISKTLTVDRFRSS